jgi:hypothetical protein
MSKQRLLGALTSLIAVALAVVHMSAPSLTMDTVTLGLLVVAALPLLATVFAEIDLPGGWHLKFRELSEEVKAQHHEMEMISGKVEEMERFVFSGGAPARVEQRLGALLPMFDGYLREIGLAGDAPLPEVRIESERASGLNAWVEDETLHVGAQIAEDPDVAFDVYARHVAVAALPHSEDEHELTALCWGVADYLTASFWGRPFIGSADAAAKMGVDTPYLRDLGAAVPFAERVTAETRRAQSEAWGAMFWCVRQIAGQARADRLVVHAWSNLWRTDPAGSVISQILGGLEAEPRAHVERELRARGNHASP